MSTYDRPRFAQRGNGTAALVIVSLLLLLLTLAVSSLLFNALRGWLTPTVAPVEHFAPIHRPYVPPPPDHDGAPKQGSLYLQHLVWLPA